MQEVTGKAAEGRLAVLRRLAPAALSPGSPSHGAGTQSQTWVWKAVGKPAATVTRGGVLRILSARHQRSCSLLGLILAPPRGDDICS